MYLSSWPLTSTHDKESSTECLPEGRIKTQTQTHTLENKLVESAKQKKPCVSQVSGKPDRKYQEDATIQPTLTGSISDTHEYKHTHGSYFF